MSVHRAAAQRGLLGGLVALVAFASLAVAMAARAPQSAGTAVSTPAAVTTTFGDGDGDARRVGFDGGRRGR